MKKLRSSLLVILLLRLQSVQHLRINTIEQQRMVRVPHQRRVELSLSNAAFGQRVLVVHRRLVVVIVSVPCSLNSALCPMQLMQHLLHLSLRLVLLLVVVLQLEPLPQAVLLVVPQELLLVAPR